jgi:hypothetical protein
MANPIMRVIPIESTFGIKNQVYPRHLNSEWKHLDEEN